MSDKLFPKEIIENTAEKNFKRHSVQTKIIYSASLLFFGVSLIVLPFIHVNVNVKSIGVIKP